MDTYCIRILCISRENVVILVITDFTKEMFIGNNEIFRNLMHEEHIRLLVTQINLS